MMREADRQVFTGSGRPYVTLGAPIALLGAFTLYQNLRDGVGPMVGVAMGVLFSAVGLTLLGWPWLRPPRVEIGDDVALIRGRRAPLEHLVVGEIDSYESRDGRVEFFDVQWLDRSDRTRAVRLSTNMFTRLEELRAALDDATRREARRRR